MFKSVVLVIFISLMVLTAGCQSKDLLSNDTTHGNPDSPTAASIQATPYASSQSVTPSTSGNEEEILETGLRKELASHLLADFKLFKNQTESDKSGYSFIMTSDRIHGLEAYKLSSSVSTLIQEEKEATGVALKDSIVFTGYSTSGIHFIAIAQPVSELNKPFEDAVNRIRGQDEYSFLQDILNFTNLGRGEGGNYYAVDLFAEDMYQKKDHVVIDDVNIIMGNSYKLDDSSKIVSGIKPLKAPNDQNMTKVLSKYNRTLTDDNIIQNQQWKLFVFENGTLATSKIIVDIDGEHVELTK